MEFALGQVTQQSAAGAFSSVHKRSHGIGLTAAVCAFLIVTYYNVILSWAWAYLIGSFTSGPLPWEKDRDTQSESSDPSVQSFFEQNVLNQASFGEVSGLGPVYWKPALGALANWLLTYLCVFKSVSSIGAVIYITLPLPFVLLLIIFLYSSSLDGFGKGISYYMGVNDDASTLAKGNVWADAGAQIFFGLSVCESSQIAYGSKNPSDSRPARNGWIVALANSCSSLFAGLVIFAGIGYLSEENGDDVDDIVKGGWALAFEVYPAVIARLPNGAKQTISIVFWLMLLMLGIDSSFALAEGVIQLLCDSFGGAERYHKLTAACVCLSGFLIGLPLMTSNGYDVLEIQDTYISRVTLIIVGLCESVTIGWVYGAKRFDSLVRRVAGRGMGIVWIITFKYVTPMLLFALFVWNIANEASRSSDSPINDYPFWAIVVFGWGYGVILPLGLGLLCGFFPTHGISSLKFAPGIDTSEHADGYHFRDGETDSRPGEASMSLSSLELAERSAAPVSSDDQVMQEAEENEGATVVNPRSKRKRGTSLDHSGNGNSHIRSGESREDQEGDGRVNSDGGLAGIGKHLSQAILRPNRYRWRQI
jgi:SNF family Na+-dependent transporter